MEKVSQVVVGVEEGEQDRQVEQAQTRLWCNSKSGLPVKRFNEVPATGGKAFLQNLQDLSSRLQIHDTNAFTTRHQLSLPGAYEKKLPALGLYNGHKLHNRQPTHVCLYL